MTLPLEGRTALIFGVANHRSIAWAIAQSLSAAGARLALPYQSRMEKFVRDLAATLPNNPLTMECDVQSDEELDRTFAEVEKDFDGLDILIHCVAFAPPAELEGRFVNTSRDGFKNTLDISAYSLIAMAKRAEPLMVKRGGGSIVCLTYMASERVFPKYNVMAVAKAALECSTRYLAADLGTQNIRVNAISAGPLNTLAARGVPGFTTMRTHQEEHAPLHRNIEQSDVGELALFLCSDASRNITGGVHFVDAGFNVMGI
jgi:enoyl-[acyl-carrier protein] reductase I